MFIFFFVQNSCSKFLWASICKFPRYGICDLYTLTSFFFGLTFQALPVSLSPQPHQISSCPQTKQTIVLFHVVLPAEPKGSVCMWSSCWYLSTIVYLRNSKNPSGDESFLLFIAILVLTASTDGLLLCVILFNKCISTLQDCEGVWWQSPTETWAFKVCLNVTTTLWIRYYYCPLCKRDNWNL